VAPLAAEEHAGKHLFGEVMLRHSYELHLSSPEEDPLQHQKDDLLACCALDGPLCLTTDVLCEVSCLLLAARTELIVLHPRLTPQVAHDMLLYVARSGHLR